MNIAVLTSGGDAPGMNAAIRAVVRSGESYGHKVFGIKDGYQGLLTNQLIRLTHRSVSGFLAKGGTFLGTARVPEFKNKEVQLQAINNLKKHKIDALIVIGGDGTYRGAQALVDHGFPCIGIPGTIDNDIAGTDFTLGFHTAVETIVDAIDKLRDTSQSHRRCSIVETMGRKSGDLALYAGICGGAEFIITPENPVDKKGMFKTLRAHKETGRRHAIIVITENILNVHDLAEEITKETEFSARATILGYIQRGGSPCPEDRILGSRMGTYAIELLNDGIIGVGVGVRDSRMIHLPLNHILEAKRPRNEMYELVKKVS
ncbi:MAG: 6-phosphofructokinase [Acholeplasmataceae bacterium]